MKLTEVVAEVISCVNVRACSVFFLQLGRSTRDLHATQSIAVGILEQAIASDLRKIFSSICFRGAVLALYSREDLFESEFGRAFRIGRIG